MNQLTIITAALAATLALSACAPMRPLTWQEREYNLRVWQTIQQGQMNLNNAAAIHHLGCIGRQYCYY